MDLPTINNLSYSNAAYCGDALSWTTSNTAPTTGWRQPGLDKRHNDYLQQLADAEAMKQFEPKPKKQETKPMPERRIVKVFIVDPDKRVPMDKCLLYSGEEKLTDATDQELFFEVSVKELLDKHNAVRESLRDDDASNKAGKDIMLKPIKIRDLVMNVVTVAAF